MRFLAVLVGLLGAVPAVADEITAATRAYGRIVAFPMPADFVAVYEAEEDGSYLLELVPSGEGVEDWSQMITLSAAEGLAPRIGDPLDMASMIGGGFRDACPETFWGSDEGAQEVDGADAAHLVAFSCGDSGGGQAETALILVALSGDDLFTLQWAARGPRSSTQVLPDMGDWRPRGEALLRLRLCPVIEGEEPPYPSCVE